MWIPAIFYATKAPRCAAACWFLACYTDGVCDHFRTFMKAQDHSPSGGGRYRGETAHLSKVGWSGRIRADYRMVMLTRLPSPWKILKSVESCTSVFPFSMREMYDFFVPIFAASCSCVSPALCRSSFSLSARINASASRSKLSRSGVPVLPYWISGISLYSFLSYLDISFVCSYH